MWPQGDYAVLEKYFQFYDRNYFYIGFVLQESGERLREEQSGSHLRDGELNGEAQTGSVGEQEETVGEQETLYILDYTS